MEQTKYAKLPLAGNIQHGIKEENGRPVELGYFIAQTKDSSMSMLVDKFHSLYKQQTKIRIRFFDENPLSIRQAKYNTGGISCYCMENEKIGKEKVKNVWQNKECLETCEHKQIINKQKPACIREGTLKFLIPEVNLDRVWILKLKAYNSLENIESYINSQKAFGNSLIGDYDLILTKQKTERKSDGKVFYNFILNILKSDNFNSTPIPHIENSRTKEEKQMQTQTVQKTSSEKTNIETLKNSKKDSNTQTTLIPEEQKKQTKKSTAKKETKKQTDKTNTEKETEKNEFENYYVFLGTAPTVVEKNGQKIDYTSARVMNGDGIETEAIINNELARELENCLLGTQIILEFTEAANRKWVKSYEFVQKQLKEAA